MLSSVLSVVNKYMLYKFRTVIYMDAYKQIHLQKLSTAAAADRYLLACNGRYYEAGAGVAELLACLQTHATEAEAVEAYVEQKQGRVSAAQVEAFIGERLQPMLSEEAQPKKRTFLLLRWITNHEWSEDLRR